VRVRIAFHPSNLILVSESCLFSCPSFFLFLSFFLYLIESAPRSSNKDSAVLFMLIMGETPALVKVAILGAGLFASNSHAPTLKKYPSLFEVVGVWSRRKESAEKLAQKIGDSCLAYGGEDELSTLLSKVEAITLVLPLDVQPEYIVKCRDMYNLHFLSEKPIAATTKDGYRLVQNYSQELDKRLLRSVGENFRYEPGIRYLADEVIAKDAIG